MVNRWAVGYLTSPAAGSFVRVVAGSFVTARQVKYFRCCFASSCSLLLAPTP